MKKRVSATIDNSTYEILDKIIKYDKSGEYRNKSHIIEKAIKYFWEGKYDKNKG